MQSTCRGHLATFAYNNEPKIIKLIFICTHQKTQTSKLGFYDIAKSHSSCVRLKKVNNVIHYQF